MIEKGLQRRTKFCLHYHGLEQMDATAYERLHIQWTLNRLMSPSGAADVEDDELYPDDAMALAFPRLGRQ
jgi:hypothetical protein